MAQSHTALRVIRGLLGKCQRGSHRERHLPPHPGPLSPLGRERPELCARLAPLNLPTAPSPRPSPPPRGRGCPEGGRGGRFMGRENPPLACTTQRGVCPTNFPNNRTCRRLFPLPVGGSG